MSRFGFRNLRSSAAERLEPVVHSQHLLWIGLLFGFYIWREVTIIALLPSSIGQLVVFLEKFFRTWLLWGVVAVPSRLIRFILLPILSYDLLTALNSGAVGDLMAWLVTLGFCILYQTGRVKSLFLCVLLALAVYAPLQSVKGQFRAKVWYDDARPTTELEILSTWAESLDELYGDRDLEESLEIAFDAGSERSSLMTLYQHVRTLCPVFVPHRGGSELFGAMVGFIPRFIWPDKPKVGDGNFFGQTFELLSFSDTSTVINTPWIIEWYWHLGDSGVLLGMLLSGVIIGLIEAVFNYRQMTVFDFCAASSIIWPRLIIHESSWGYAFSGLPLVIGFYLVVRPFVSRFISLRHHG